MNCKPVPTAMPVQAAPLFPCMNSMADVEAFARACLPITDPNELHALLKVHQNTLLKLNRKE